VRAFTLTLDNHGRAGAVLHTRVRTSSAPQGLSTQMHTVGARRETQVGVPVDAGRCDVRLHGPNGFHRHLTGPAAAGPEVELRHDRGGRARLRLSNQGPAVELTLVDHHGTGRPATVRLRQGGTLTRALSHRDHGWYDVEVTGAAGFVRRLSGHLENGRPSVSDPALGG
jgi:phospholipase C